MNFSARATGAIRAILSLGVAYAFLLILMTASAQQRVVAKLDGDGGAAGADYAAGLARLKEAEGDLKELRVVRGQRALAAGKFELLSTAEQDASILYEDAGVRVQRLAEAAERSKDCPSEAGAPPSVRWGRVVSCAEGDVLPKALSNQIRQADARSDGVTPSYRHWLADKRAKEAQQRVLDVMDAEIKRLDQATPSNQRLVSQFSELDVIRSSWLMGRGVLVEFPPVLMQILLAASSGAFGALLVTLVLVVYPQTNFAFASGGAFGPRVALGALISVCTFVVLGGGAAVLGSSAAFDSGQANFMTFCAVGLLAGMFSDRVAFWLSERANAFFVEAKAQPETAE